nr:elongin-B-like [Kogia breviceps]
MGLRESRSPGGAGWGRPGAGKVGSSARVAGKGAERGCSGASRGRRRGRDGRVLRKTAMFTDAKESSTVFELKRIVEDILRRPLDEQRAERSLLDDGKTLGECGFTSQTAGPQVPATVGLAFRADEAFVALRIEPFSNPPKLPHVMKP